MIEDGLAWQYQLQIEYSNCKAFIFNFLILISNNIYIYIVRYLLLDYCLKLKSVVNMFYCNEVLETCFDVIIRKWNDTIIRYVFHCM